MTRFRWLLAGALTLAVPGTLAWGQHQASPDEPVSHTPVCSPCFTPDILCHLVQACQEQARMEDLLCMWQLLWDSGLYGEAAALAAEAVRCHPTCLNTLHAHAVSQIVSAVQHTEKPHACPPESTPDVPRCFKLHIGSDGLERIGIDFDFRIEVGSDQVFSRAKGATVPCDAEVKPACAKGGHLAAEVVQCGHVCRTSCDGCPIATSLNTLFGILMGQPCCGASCVRACLTSAKAGSSTAKCLCGEKCECAKSACRCGEKCRCAAKACACGGQCPCSKKAACACGPNCACAKGECACGANCPCKKTQAPRRPVRFMHPPVLPPHLIQGMMLPPPMPHCMPGGDCVMVPIMVPMAHPPMAHPPMPHNMAPVAGMTMPGLPFGVMPVAALPFPAMPVLPPMIQNECLPPPCTVGAPPAPPHILVNRPSPVQRVQAQPMPGQPVPGHPMPPRPPLAPVMHYDMVTPPEAEPCVDGLIDRTLHIKAMKDGMHVRGGHFDAHCDNVIMSDNHRCLLEGNVRINIRREHQPGRIEAERVAVNLKDGTFEVNPRRSLPMPRMVPDRPVGRPLGRPAYEPSPAPAAEPVLPGRSDAFQRRKPTASAESRVDNLLNVSDELRQIQEEMQRFWLLDEPSHMNVIRVHPGRGDEWEPRPATPCPLPKPSKEGARLFTPLGSTLNPWDVALVSPSQADDREQIFSFWLIGTFR